MPPLGRHYSEVWEEQDQALFHGDGTSLPPQTPTSGHINGLMTHPANLSPLTATGKSSSESIPPEPIDNKDLPMQKKSLGPFTERVISALLGTPDHSVSQVPEAEASGVGPQHASTIPLAPVSFLDIETRLKLELRACGLIGVDEVGWSLDFFQAQAHFFFSPTSPNPTMTKLLGSCGAFSLSYVWLNE